MMWLLSFMGSNYSFVIAGILAIVALGAFAWVTRNLKTAIIAAVILALGFAAMALDRNAYQRRVNEEAQAQVRLLNARLGTLELVKAANTKQLAADTKYITELEKRASETPKNNNPCLDADAARRVRAIR